MEFLEKWVEYDYNPIIFFNEKGKIKSLNAEAQFLLGQASANELFELATTYGSETYGFKTTFLNLEFGRFRFFAIAVGYESEREIGIRLYQLPSLQYTPAKEQGELVNIYSLIDLCISSSSINTKATFKKDIDPTLPDVRLQADQFLKLLNKIYSSASGKELITNLFLRVGEYVKFESKKHTIFSLVVKADKFDSITEESIKSLASQISLYAEIKPRQIRIDFALISS